MTRLAWLGALASLAATPLVSAQEYATAGAVVQEAAEDARLATAMRNRDIATVRTLLAEGFDVNSHDAETASALHWAAHWNDLEAVELLLEAGADPNLANRFGVTPLHEAALAGNAAMLERMIEAGGNANAEFGEGETVLMTAARAGDAAAVRALLAHGGDADAAEGWHGQTALMWAAIEGHTEVADLLIAHGAEIDRRSTAHDWIEISYSAGNVPKRRDVGGLTALHFAARHGSIEVAERLLDAGADPSAVEPMYELTPLQLAIVNGHYTLAMRLIERGVDIDDGSLYLAIDTRHLGFYAQRPNPPDKDGDVTNLDVISALLAHGVDASLPYSKGIPERTVAGEIKVPRGATPLDRAAMAGDFDVIEALIAHGADPSVAAADGTTPLMLLSGFSRQAFGAPPQVSGDPRRQAVIRLLIEHGADVDAVQKQSRNGALHFAAMRGAADLVALLKEFGASEDLKNADGRSPSELLAAPEPKT
jgi:ankyrin repeat protein